MLSYMKSRYAGKIKNFYYLIFILFLTAEIYPQWVASNGPFLSNVHSLAVNGKYLFAGLGGFAPNGIYRSTDYGSNWLELTPAGLNNLWINALAVYPFNTGDTIVFLATMNGIYSSSDNGTNWMEINSGLPQNRWITSFAYDGNNLFTSLYYGGIYCSTDMGKTWTPSGLSDKNIMTLAVTPNGEILFAGVEGYGVYKSTDNGMNWTSINSGLPVSTTIESFSVISNELGETNLFAGTYFGLFRSSDNGENWVANADLRISAFVVSGTNLFAGAIFEGGVYNSTDSGINWLPVDSGLTNKDIRTLAVDNMYLFAGTAGVLGDNKGDVWRRPLSEMITAVDNTSELPKNFILYQNYPNPFNPATSIEYRVGRSEYVTLKIYDVLGNKVATLVSEEKPVGSYEVTWNAEGLSSGVYFYQLKAGEFIATKKLLLLK